MKTTITTKQNYRRTIIGSVLTLTTCFALLLPEGPRAVASGRDESQDNVNLSLQANSIQVQKAETLPQQTSTEKLAEKPKEQSAEKPGVTAALDKSRELLRTGKFEAALHQATEVAKQFPDSYQPGYVSAYALFRLGKTEEADQQAHAALALAPEEDRPLVDNLLKLIEHKHTEPKSRYVARRWQARNIDKVTSRYTVSSIVIEAKSLGVERDMAPKIRRQDGSEVWGTKEVDPDYVISDGIVIYTHTVPDARKTNRSGRFPLILKAIAKGNSPTSSDVIISDEDAKRLLAANAYCHCLDNNNVIFVIDR